MKNSAPFILIILAIALFFTFTNPQYKKVKEIKEVANQYNGILDSIDEIQSRRDALLEDYKKIDQKEIDKMFKALPESVDSVHLALDLDKIASQHNIALSSVGVSNGGDPNQVTLNTPGPYEKVRITLSFVSNYDDLLKFLTDMEKSLRILDIKSITFNTTDNGLNKYEVVLETYWHKK